tara:strand:- start:57 stop:278 length:222 start_codon:yes stop_codon:yes gene_type:complete
MRYFKLSSNKHSDGTYYSIWETSDEKTKERRIYHSNALNDNNPHKEWTNYTTPNPDHELEAEITKEEAFLEMI